MSEETNVAVSNKRAYFEYHILDTYIAGVQLLGTEIKSVRQAKVNLNDAYCAFVNEELYVFNMHISEYSHGSFYNHEAKRNRKLLLTKKELKKLHAKLKDVGTTVVPLKLFISDRGFAKLEIGLAKGKNVHDKRDTIKERESKIELSRVLR